MTRSGTALPHIRTIAEVDADGDDEVEMEEDDDEPTAFSAFCLRAFCWRVLRFHGIDFCA